MAVVAHIVIQGNEESPAKGYVCTLAQALLLSFSLGEESSIARKAKRMKGK